jgi:hypothetical protein
MTCEYVGVKVAHPAQVVLEYDPYCRLGYTRQTGAGLRP